MTETTPIDCDRRTPRANHFDLFRAMNVPWKGCVEARPYPLDMTDDPPSLADPDTFFVPYFWPDERDDKNTVRNNYVDDMPSGTRPSWVKNGDWFGLRRAWVWKYNAGAPLDLSDIANRPNMLMPRGPNLACPNPIVPLTNSRDTLLSAADELVAWGGSGTNIALGLAWAWRMISSNFVSEALPNDPDSRKFLILMTDGFNDVVDQDNELRSDYTGTGYAQRQRLGAWQRHRITEELDKRTAQVCERVKDQDIEIFTVLYDPFGYDDTSGVEALLSRCATTNRHVFQASTRDDLIAAFKRIGNQINALRISR
ncbi:MAG: VWA domain-containing protein [Salinarimonadaceae bacterium]|nr:MAG: VWA domain-containing protein [Salinarimonadaceae bacterium]